MAIRRSVAVLILLLAPLARPADAQDLNVKCGLAPVPSPAFGAASGQAGVWNELPMYVLGGPSTPLVGLDGRSTGATAIAEFCDSARCDWCPTGCPWLAGTADELALFGSWFNGDCFASGHHVTVSDLAPGSYRMHLYLYHGCNPSSVSSVQLEVLDRDWNTVDSSFFQLGGQPFQGTWSGFPVGVHDFEIAPGDSIRIQWGSSFGGVCGFQLERLDETGAAFCPGDGSVVACPCGYDGGTSRGCQNSTLTGGAVLFASGSASLSSDTLQFASAWERRTALTILLQGNALIAPVPFGDGLRCTGGSLKRLYSRSAVQGAVVAPMTGELSVSARSAQTGDTILVGATRWYQAYYRDTNATYCPPPQGSNFNSSSGVAITWGG